MSDTPARVVLTLASVAVGFVCLWRAWHLGRDGMDYDRNIRKPLQYPWVRVWGTIGIGLIFMPVMMLLASLLPPVPGMR